MTLHQCPSCKRVFDSPSVCSSGTETVPMTEVEEAAWRRATKRAKANIAGRAQPEKPISWPPRYVG